jgi:hypothetical protein
MKLYKIEGREFFAFGESFDAQFIAVTQHDLATHSAN